MRDRTRARRVVATGDGARCDFLLALLSEACARRSARCCRVPARAAGILLPRRRTRAGA
jgi:hypothetical protein